MLGSLWFRGNVLVYLEGEKALLPILVQPPHQMEYLIGAEYTGLIIKDFRMGPNLAAAQVINGNKDFDFSSHFNQPAFAEVSEENGTLQINLYETDVDNDYPILWLGVIRDGKMPVQNVIWEVLRPASQKDVAFAALVMD